MNYCQVFTSTATPWRFGNWVDAIRQHAISLAWLVAILIGSSAAAQEDSRVTDPARERLSQSVLNQQASWQLASYASVRQELFDWMQSMETSDLQRLKIEAIWPDAEQPSGDSQPLLDRLSMTLPILIPETASVLDRLQLQRRTSELPPELSVDRWSDDPRVDGAMRLLVGRWLCENEFYDEALDQLRGLDVDRAIDPASLLYYRGIAAQRILEKESTITDFEMLLENSGRIPRRYERIAELVLADIKPLKTDTLEEIAKLMEDVRRRQSLHRSGARVLEQEQQVVDKLAKLIEQLEKEQQDPRSGQPGPSGSAAPSRAMDASRIAGGRGEGNVDRKSQSAGRAWGNLDPQDRAAALAELAKDLPAHYREVIEDYFRKLAEDDKINPR